MQSNPNSRTRPDQSSVRRVLIEERQQNTLDHARVRGGYADDVRPDAHDPGTFRLINQRKALDTLEHADVVVPALDQWKHWTKMRDWDSRNSLLEDTIAKLRRREATPAEVELLVVVCRPAWASVRASLRRYGGADLDPGAGKVFGREEALRVNSLDRSELDAVIHVAFFDAVLKCPSPFPRFFFPWLKKTLLWRALEHIQADLQRDLVHLPYDTGIRGFLDEVLHDDNGPVAPFHRAPASPGHSQWIRTLDLPNLFRLADEYSFYARSQTACERAVDKLAPRQRQVIRQRYYEEMTEAQIASERGVASSTVRNTHNQATRNLEKDDELFDVLEAIGTVRDAARRKLLEEQRNAA